MAEWNRARESLRAAETLTREGFYADAISRAYYAILHSAKAALPVRNKACGLWRGYLQVDGTGSFNKSTALPEIISNA